MNAEAKGRKRTLGYKEISTTLIREIQQGTWSVNGLLPSEMDLVQRFGVGRNTVREALRELQDLGYLKRRRGARSVLESANPESGFVNSVRSVGELLEYARSTHSTLLGAEHIRVSEALAQRLDCPPDSEWVRIPILRAREPNGSPFCLSEVYVDPRYGDVVKFLDTENEIYSIIEREYGVVVRRVVQTIEAAEADPNIASRLNIAIGSPILLVRTIFHGSDGKVVEIGLAHFPAGRYKVRIALDRKAG
jgi:DNA-binding GntR family transcriptional regulator